MAGEPLTDPPRCPRCGEDRLLTETDDGLFVTCDVCSFTFGKDRPALNANDVKMLKARGISPGRKGQAVVAVSAAIQCRPGSVRRRRDGSGY